MKREDLYSKRNTVFRLYTNSGNYIVKKFKDNKFLNEEYKILKLLLKENLHVPNVLYKTNEELVLEDLGNITLLDWMAKQELNDSMSYHKIILELYSFLQKFYRVIRAQYGRQYIINDINLRNFILKDNYIYGIDFELICEGCIVTDIGKMIAYIITYNPVATKWKYKFVNDLVHIFSLNFNLNKVRLLNEVNLELHDMKLRRHIEYEVDDIVCKIAEELI